MTILIFTANAQDPTDPGLEIDYTRDIAPLFSRHCNDCHGADRAENDFRVDSAAALRAELDSPFPLLGDTLESNEIYLRVTSDDPKYRMPAEGDPLSANELDIIRRWIVQGMPIDDADDSTVPRHDLLDTFYAILYSDPRWVPLLLLLLATNVVILGVERGKRAARQRETPDGGHAPILRIGAIHYLFIWTLFAFPVGFVYHEIAMNGERELLEEARARLDRGERYRPGSSIESQFGNPPTPTRMNHPTAVQREYYRGNDERHPRLFNGGYYRTSTMHVRLVHGDGVALDIGDEIRSDEAYIEYAFDRAPHTLAGLYGDSVLQAIFASSRYPWSEAVDDPDRNGVEVVEPGRQWRVRYRLAVGEDVAGPVQRLVYVYYRGRPHYGIGYDLKIEDGKLMEGSDVWLGNLWTLGNLMPPLPDGYITQFEWVDYEPIPVIPQPQSVTDPDLLGATEHLGSGALLH